MSVHAWVTRAPIAADSVLALVGGPEDGAIDVFLGTVRDHNEGSAVAGVDYEAYVEMAEQVLRDIVSEAASQAGVGDVAAVHRIGALQVGEVSVAIAASAPHRAEAFAACRYVIEQVKQRLPVWKQERYAGGSEKWLAGEVPRAG